MFYNCRVIFGAHVDVGGAVKFEIQLAAINLRAEDCVPVRPHLCFGQIVAIER